MSNNDKNELCSINGMRIIHLENGEGELVLG